ncbi:MAG: hypothetical protein AVDCRST_MAG91-687 [uncultured Sphingomonadaceae bacterium]|uniref:Ice-binding protein C-terminal domain-containing protein n=1 Tax=uncultured Sphingomonadaceae bacterium TaxID=169976 RepID=A0A6J4SAJ2_9SPHN|nr:MAG: hypothetical protein AVDCRST_MAG91-687 [uncultured Sphingomonadaceae bacterium]
MTNRFRLFVATALTGAALVATPCSAARFFDFSYSGLGIAASGRLTTNDTPSRGALTITDVTGQRNGATIDRLFPAGTTVDEDGNTIDNRLFTSMPFLSFNGFGFGTVGSDALFNPFFAETEYQEFVSINGVGIASQIIDFSLAEVSVSSAVPEPGAWAMMLVGFGAVGFAMRRRPNTTVSVRFA